jgi:hypothetical protein
MTIVIGIALGFILVGMVMALWGKSVTPPLLGTVLHVVGVCLIIIGLVLLLTPVLVWVNSQFRSMLSS